MNRAKQAKHSDSMSRKYKFHNPEGVYFVSFANIEIRTEEGLVFRARDYRYSGACDYARENGMPDIFAID